MVGAPVRRCQVAYAKQRGLSVRRACALMSVARSALRYESRLVKRDAPTIVVMQELAAQYPRYGYRRIQVFLERQGHRMSAGRAYRLWRQCGLQVTRNRPRRRIASGRPRPLPATGEWPVTGGASGRCTVGASHQYRTTTSRELGLKSQE
jgi:putative transposase